jgi:hypothetical protein
VIGATCTQAVHDRSATALIAYEHTAAAAKARYFRTHRSGLLRRAYVTAQAKRLAALKAAAACHVPAVDVIASPDVAAADADTVRAGVAAAQSSFAAAGLPALDAKIFAYGSQAAVEQAYIAYYGVSQANADQLWGTATAAGSDGVVFVNTGTHDWQVVSPAERAKIVAHELFHIEQSTLDPAWDSGSRGAIWLLEGSAEYMGWSAVVAAGQVSQDAVQSEVSAEATLANGTLADYEGDAAYTLGALYPLGYLAVQKLVQDHGVASLAAYWRDLGAAASWQDAFRQAFGLTPAAFYALFSAR